ncbi:MAG: hypothetical protein R6U40_08565 [Desulfobacterales bacterium]
MMKDISAKYSLLTKSAKKEVHDFMDFLLMRQKTKKKIPLSDYKKKIFNVSTWSDNDIKAFEENKKLFNEWNIQEW